MMKNPEERLLEYEELLKGKRGLVSAYSQIRQSRRKIICFNMWIMVLIKEINCSGTKMVVGDVGGENK